MKVLKAEPVIDYRAVHGESPFWDNDEKKLLWADALRENDRGQELHIFNPRTGEDDSWFIGQDMGAIIPTKNGKILINLVDGIYIFDKKQSELKKINNVESTLYSNRLNDGKCDSTGRFWFGSMYERRKSTKPGKPIEKTGNFYSLDSKNNLTCFFGDIGISNGIAWNDVETKMYYVDTLPQSIFEFDFNLATGRINNRKIAIKIDISEGRPDGLTIDEENMLWVAHFEGGKVSRWNPETGEKLCEVILPCPLVTSCVFGGDNLDELYITTSSKGYTENELYKYPDAGKLFVVKPGVKGKPLYKSNM